MRAPAILVALIGCGNMYGTASQPAPAPQPQYVQGPPGASYDPPPSSGEIRGNPYTPQGELGDNPYGSPPPDPHTTGGELGRNPYRNDPGEVVDTPVPADARRPPPPATSEAQQLVDAHNKVRALHCAAPLSWSPKLAQVAQAWANTLRDKGCAFGHSGGQYGENLAAGTTGAMGPEAVVQMWYEEVKDYKFPDGGFSMQTGHFTQVVWRGTTQVGCGHSQCKGNDIWVCNYDPAGNWDGQYRENVLPASCKK
jgi:uncharacterized protein YkwD